MNVLEVDLVLEHLSGWLVLRKPEITGVGDHYSPSEPVQTVLKPLSGNALLEVDLLLVDVFLGLLGLCDHHVGHLLVEDDPDSEPGLVLVVALPGVQRLLLGIFGFLRGKGLTEGKELF